MTKDKRQKVYKGMIPTMVNCGNCIVAIVLWQLYCVNCCEKQYKGFREI